MTYGLKISKKGFDVGTAANKDLAFFSDFNSMKVFSSGSINKTTTGTVTISHNLGYIPAFLGFVHINGGANGGNSYPLPDDNFPAGSTAPFIYAGTGNLNIVVGSIPFDATSIDLKYVIYLNKII